MISALPTRDAATPAWLLGAAAVVAGLAILLARPAVATTIGWDVPVVVVLFVLVGALGLAAPLHGGMVRRRSWALLGATLVAGTAVFAVGRLLAAGHSPQPATVTIIGLNTLAAVGEEALFRRAAFALLLPFGPVAAVGGSALLFGIAHVTVYGWWAFPLDVAAGLVFGWQRWISGSWAVPAVTHALADLLVVL